MLAPQTGARAEETAYDSIVVCPPALQGALRPWFAHRLQQGHKIGVISEVDTPEQIRAGVARGGKRREADACGDRR